MTTPPAQPEFVPNASQLATALGTSRQRIAYWQKQPDAPRPTPDGFDVDAWDEYLTSKARFPESRQKLTRPNLLAVVHWVTAERLMHVLGEALVEFVPDELPGATKEQGELAAARLWLVMAIRTESYLRNGYLDKVFEAEGMRTLEQLWRTITGAPIEPLPAPDIKPPQVIQAIAERIKAAKKKK